MVTEQLGGLFRVRSGDGISIANLGAFGTYPVYGGNGINGYTSNFNVENGTMVIGRVGEKCGNVNITQSKSWVSDNALIVTPKIKYDIGYMSYLLEQINLNDYANRNAQPVISGQIIYAIETSYVEDIKEQEVIAQNLRNFDIYINDLAELIEKKRGIRDGALENLICHQKRLNGFNDEWTKVSFNQVIIPKARIGWQGLKKHEYLRSGYSYLIGGTDFSHGTVSLENIWYVSKERYDMDANIQVSENDVLVTKDGTIGKVALVPELEKPATLNSGVFVFRTTNRLLPTFLFRVLSSSVFRDFIDSLSAGSTIKHLYQKDLKNFEFEIPVDKKEQEAIANTLTDMDEEIEALEIERDKMIQIREGAMDDLLTGRVRLSV